MLFILLAIMALLTAPFCVTLLRAVLLNRARPLQLETFVLGAITNFFDTLGVGSFAPTMAWFKFRRLVPDRLIPATMLAGHALPIVTQAAIFLILLGIKLDPVVLLSCIVAFVAGVVIGAPLVAKLPLAIIQSGVAVALLLAATLYAMANLDLMPLGGTATTLQRQWFVIAIATNFVVGVLTNFGVGNYAPTLIILSLLGMDPHLIFPIMASGGAYGFLVVGRQHISSARLEAKIALSMALGGIPAVLVAAFILREMRVQTLRWLVVMVAVSAAVLMLRSAVKPSEPEIVSA
jgi:uncharacterized membrane protein YfcA